MSNLPDIKKDFPAWYQAVVYRAELADLAPVRGCIVVRPYGYSIWENMRSILDEKIKKTGHKNAIFPLLIPKSFLEKEAEHVTGFSPELAVVTHAGGKKLDEPLVVRPTSETVIHHMFARWIKSWRDLPMKVNQWANVVRWEMRTRPFLRTSEFWWQEGHTAHETLEEAQQEVELMFGEYADFVENYLAIPAILGKKTDSEKFAGADFTKTIESLMPDGKALQMLTVHMISRSFADSFDIKFQDRNGVLSYPFLTSWGATTRLIGAVIMVHGDSKGLVLPPVIAPIQVVIIPIIKKESKKEVLEFVGKIKDFVSDKVRVEVDDDENLTPGSKFYNWELKGVPIRIEVGPRDLGKSQVVLVNRIDGSKEICLVNSLQEVLKKRLDEIQESLLVRARERLNSAWHKREKLVEFAENLNNSGGIYQTGWCGDLGCENQLKKIQASIRCIIDKKEFEKCFACDKASIKDVLVAKSY